jgi:hypothetical protein
MLIRLLKAHTKEAMEENLCQSFTDKGLILRTEKIKHQNKNSFKRTEQIHFK